MQLGNVMPQDIVEVELVYSEEVEKAEGKYKFVLPATVGPRYLGEDKNRDSSIFRKLRYLSGDSKIKNSGKENLSINIKLDTGFLLGFVKSNFDSSKILMDESGASVSYATNNFNKDFEFTYKDKAESIRSGFLVHKGEDENFFL